MLLESGEWRTGQEEWNLVTWVCQSPGSDLTWLESDSALTGQEEDSSSLQGI